MKRSNCWEILECGRHPDGKNTPTCGVCPAALTNEFDGVNGGQHAGRFCWAVAGTLCGGEIQGNLVKKLMDCYRCVFLQQVDMEEGFEFALTPTDARNQQEGKI